MKIVGAIFKKIEILIYFLMWTTLNFRGSSKTGTPEIEFEQDWSVALGAISDDGPKIKNYLSSLSDFSGRSR